jgi:molybdenum cofactor cytidylyltransferase
MRVGAAAVPRGTGTALVVNVDQPRPAAVFRRLMDAHRERAAVITRPTYGDAHGHPIVLGEAALAEARNVTDEKMGLRAVVDRHRHELLEVPFDDPVVLLDLNTPEEYERALAAWNADASDR